MTTARTAHEPPPGAEHHGQRTSAPDRLAWDRLAAPSDAAALLQTVTTIAEGLTELLDQVRAGYPPRVLSTPDPIFVDLDQASAAAHDLSTSTRSAIDKLATR